jgi:hypothetical protein
MAVTAFLSSQLYGDYSLFIRVTSKTDPSKPKTACFYGVKPLPHLSAWSK